MAKKTIEFYSDAAGESEGDSVLLVAITGTPELIKRKLIEMAQEIDAPYGKPIQGCVSQYGGISHVLTPRWSGKEY